MRRARNEVDELIEGTPGWRGAVLARIRRLVLAADPETTEAVKWRRPANPMGAAVWEHAGIVCIGGVLKERVRLTLYAGAKLPDPKRLFNAMLVGNQARAIDVREGDRLDEGALKALVRAGVMHNLARRSRAGAAASRPPRRRSSRSAGRSGARSRVH